MLFFKSFVALPCCQIVLRPLLNQEGSGTEDPQKNSLTWRCESTTMHSVTSGTPSSLVSKQ